MLSIDITMKFANFASVSAFSLFVSLARASTIHVAHSIPSNIQKLYNAVKNGGCQHYIHHNHTLSDGEGNRGETSGSPWYRYTLTPISAVQGLAFVQTTRIKDLSTLQALAN
jgi:hypothetical protein